jgi:hypothetical protein
VLSVVWDFVEASEAFLATAHPDVAAAAAAAQAAAGGFEGVPDYNNSLADGGGFGRNVASLEAQAYCAAAAAYVAAACRAAAAAGGSGRSSSSSTAAAASVAGVTLRAVCTVFAVQETPLGSAWTLGGGVYGGWCASFLGHSGRFVDPALAALAAAASEGADTAAAAAAGAGAMEEEEEDGGGSGPLDALTALQAATQRCARLADSLADAAAAAAAAGGGGSWWGPPAARLTLSAMTASVGRALVRLGVAAANAAADGGQIVGQARSQGMQQWQGLVGAGPVGEGGVPLRGLLMMGGGGAGGPALAAAAVSCVGA